MNTACNILTDIVFATLPVPVIWRLQMALRTRRYLAVILSLGYLAVIIGIVKAVCQNLFRGDPDQSFTNWIQFWGFMQVSVGIIAACAPSLKPLVGRALKLSSAKKSSNAVYNHGTSGSMSGRRAPAAIHVGSAGASRAWAKTKSETNEYEMDSISFDKLEEQRDGNLARLQAGSPTGSEEEILKNRRSHTGRGIMRTVEVSVE
jgi:hypothetical protein